MSKHFIYGLHAVVALLNNSSRRISQLFINYDRNDQRLEIVLDLARQRDIPVEMLSAQIMNQRFAKCVHQGVVASTDNFSDYSDKDLLALLKSAKPPAFILILDGITDPHNLGACLRTAEACGVDFVIIPKDKNASITPVVSKVACGAAELIPLVRVTNLVRAIEVVKQEGIWVYGAVVDVSQTIYQLNFQLSPIALVMGSEGEGLRRLTRKHCDGLFALPMFGNVGSLNVSVAAGISLYEVVRQRSSSDKCLSHDTFHV